MKKYRLLVTLLVSIVSCFMSASEYGICFGSYLTNEAAEESVKQLAKINLPAVIVPFRTASGQLFNRIFFDTKYPTREIALQQKSVLEQIWFFHDHGITDLWVTPWEAAVLPDNDSTLPLSAERPYSVKIGDYKEEERAEHDRERLAEHDVDSYVVKSYNDDTLLNFALHSGAFTTPEDAAVYRDEIAEKGLNSVSVSDFTQFEDDFNKYNELSDEEKVKPSTELYNSPENIDSIVIENVKLLPVHADYQLESFRLYDLNHIRACNNPVSIGYAIGDAEDVPVTEAGVSAVSMAVYCDTLFDREIHISIQSSAAEPFEINQAFFKSCFPSAEGCEESVISGERNVLTGYRSRTEEGIAFAGVTSDSRHRVVFYARGLEQAEFDTLVSQMLDESGESVSADIKKSLYVLSDEHIDGLNFLAFTLSKVKNDYAERRGNTLWAQQIVGHWDASFSFDWNGRSCNIGLYNLDYEKNAVENQRLFTAENHVKPDSGICEIELHGMPGWYAENDKRHELSFAQKEYCIAVNSYGDELVSQEELVTLTEQLQIWK